MHFHFDLLLVFEIIGTIAFALSGAFVAMEKHMDIFGVVILGLTTAVGGGIIRDMIIGVTPPIAFQEPVYAAVAIGTSVIAFVPKLRELINHPDSKVILIMDTIGLGVFTVIGVRAGMNFENEFLSIFLGALTGVVGGVLRDLFAKNPPYIFYKHFYACASLCGALLTVLLWRWNVTYAMLLGAILVIVLRLLAAKNRWKLPKA